MQVESDRKSGQSLSSLTESSPRLGASDSDCDSHESEAETETDIGETDPSQIAHLFISVNTRGQFLESLCNVSCKQ